MDPHYFYDCAAAHLRFGPLDPLFDPLCFSNLPSFFLLALRPSFAASSILLGLDCTGRLFVSDRAHLVFDIHQIIDGLKELELGRGR